MSMVWSQQTLLMNLTGKEKHVGVNAVQAMVDRTVQDAVARREPFVIEYHVAHASGEIRSVYEKGRGVFAGRVVVRPDAQKVQARQTNNNLLLSDTALAQSTPQLEIHADDVQCFHGSTIGQLDDDMLFYLRSRGIAGDSAREVLTMAFANAILEKVSVPALRQGLESVLFPEARL